MSEKESISWGTLLGRSAVVAAVAAGGATFVAGDALLLLSGLFSLGFLAGFWSRQHGWLVGTLVGLPAALLRVWYWAGPDAGSEPWWRLAAPAALVAAGLAIIGSMSGAWLRGRTYKS